MICTTPRHFASALALLMASGCTRPADPPPLVAPTPVVEPVRTLQPAPTPRVEIVPAPPGPVAQMIAERLLILGKDRTLLVDVGASWCEPCRRLHDAARQGRLDREFPGLMLLEFDWDLDKDRLREAGYDSKLLPLLAVPRPDGRMSDRMLTGSVKGESAVEGNLVPRLHDLLAGRPAQ